MADARSVIAMINFYILIDEEYHITVFEIWIILYPN